MARYREVHGRPSNLCEDPNPHIQGSIMLERGSVVLKACVCTHQVQRPVLDLGKTDTSQSYCSSGGKNHPY